MFSMPVLTTTKTFRGQLRRPPGGCYEAGQVVHSPLLKKLKSWYATCANNLTDMAQKPNKKIFHLNAMIDGHLIIGSVGFSPAPQPGILTELARFEAERILTNAVREEIARGRF